MVVLLQGSRAPQNSPEHFWEAKAKNHYSFITTNNVVFTVCLTFEMLLYTNNAYVFQKGVPNKRLIIFGGLFCGIMKSSVNPQETSQYAGLLHISVCLPHLPVIPPLTWILKLWKYEYFIDLLSNGCALLNAAGTDGAVLRWRESLLFLLLG